MFIYVYHIVISIRITGECISYIGVLRAVVDKPASEFIRFTYAKPNTYVHSNPCVEEHLLYKHKNMTIVLLHETSV
jgi:hypothetical protein